MEPYFVPEQYYFGVPHEPVLRPAGDPQEFNSPASLPKPMLLPDNGPYSTSVPELLPDLLLHESKDSSIPSTDGRRQTGGTIASITSGSVKPVATPDDELRNACKSIRERTPTRVFEN